MSLTEEQNYIWYSDDASYDFMPTKKSMKIVKMCDIDGIS